MNVFAKPKASYEWTGTAYQEVAASGQTGAILGLAGPDADQSGDEYTSDVTHLLQEIGCEVSVIDARALAGVRPDGGKRELEDGWDAANALIEWSDLGALRRAAISYAKPLDPEPAFVSWGAFTMSGQNGLTVEVKQGKGENATAEDVWVSSAFEIIGASRDPSGHGWGKWLRWRDADQRVHTRQVADSALQGDPSALCGVVTDAGLRVNRTQQRMLVNYVSGVEVQGRVTHVDRTGWHEIDGHQVFVLPDETIGPVRLERVVLDTPATCAYETRARWPEVTPCRC